MTSPSSGVTWAVPARACDCHMHVFGPASRYPAATRRSYQPRESRLDDWRELAVGLGLTRCVVVQASAYGSDNSGVVDTVATLGQRNARGVAGIDERTDRGALLDLHAAGIRGVRLNWRAGGQADAAVQADELADVGKRVADLGWHVEVHAGTASVVTLARSIRDAPCPIVLDHVAGIGPKTPADDVGVVRDLLSSGHCWVKLSGLYRVTGSDSDPRGAIPAMRLLVDDNPDRIVFGTDWPHTAAHPTSVDIGRSGSPIAFRHIDESAQLQAVAEACPSQDVFDAVLADNPARLYQF